jgi:DNA-directed RNA polymerase specialized sigma24 family protein
MSRARAGVRRVAAQSPDSVSRATSIPRERRLAPLDVWRELPRLHSIERAVYVLHWVFGYSQPEVASALNMTEAAVAESFERVVEQLVIQRLSA